MVRVRLTRFFGYGVLTLAILGSALVITPGRIALARPGDKASCFGTMRVSPATVHMGSLLQISGAHFTCRTPKNKLFPQATIFLYRPKVGFAAWNVHVQGNGTYSKQIHVPPKISPVSAATSGSKQKVATKPGMYYLSLRLVDLAMPTAAQAFAHVTIVG